MPIVTVQFDADTHKVVPLEPTIDMEATGVARYNLGFDSIDIYQGMIAAAPDAQPVTLEETPPEVSPEDVQKALDDIKDNIHPDGRISVLGGMQLLDQSTMETIRRTLLSQLKS